MDGSIKMYIIDYATAFKISTGQNDPETIHWMEEGFNWEGSYREFVDFDFIYWKQFIANIPLPHESSFHNLFDEKTVNRYLVGDCGLLAIKLSQLSNWPIYGVSMIQPGRNYSVPAHYLVRVPGGEYLLDINGLKPTRYYEGYWRKYFLNEGETNFTIKIHAVDELLCNPDYYEDVINNPKPNDQADIVSAHIWEIIENQFIHE